MKYNRKKKALAIIARALIEPLNMKNYFTLFDF